MKEIKIKIKIVTEQHYVSIFFTRLWSVRKPLLFRDMGRLVTNQQKCHFPPVFASFLLVVWFCIYTHAQLRILKFQDFVYQKAELCVQTINEWRISKRSVFLLRRQDIFWTPKILDLKKRFTRKHTNVYISWHLNLVIVEYQYLIQNSR